MTRDPCKTVNHETAEAMHPLAASLAHGDQPGRDVDLPVTITINHSARPEKIHDLEVMIEAATTAFAACPGFRAAQLFRPSRPGDVRFQVVLSFDRKSDFIAWQSSAVCGEWLKKIEPLIQRPARRELRPGVAPWFDLPGHESSPSPRRYKMAIVGWLGALPTVSVVQATIIPLLGDTPVLLRLAILTALMSVLLNYVVMPGMTRVFASWLYPAEAR